ncbi:MAG TPA: hypothetical protein VMU19_01980 [Bryobacteraceae bacterium]|nr:hypothetical protein [Bryobacteraceae bacterium]
MDTNQVIQGLEDGWGQAFGIAMPRLAPDWSPSGASGQSFTVVDQTPGASDSPIMTVTCSGANWAAPIDAAFAVVPQGAPMPVTLLQASGAAETAPGLLLTVPDQAWLRLGRLYCKVLEAADSKHPEEAEGLSCRPVPRYIFFPKQTITVDNGPLPSGLARAWDDLGFSGDARFYDGDGLQIDPIAAMAAFEAILTKYPGLQAVPWGTAPLTTLPLTNYLSNLASTTVTRVRLVKPDGGGYTASPMHLTGLKVVDAASALYELDGSPPSIGLDAVDSNSFPQYEHDRLLFGPATSGRLSSSFTPPAEPKESPGISLKRDFYSIRVVELQPYLTGSWPASDPASAVQRYPSVRINENISFLLDGNAVLGGIHAALESGSPAKPPAHGSPGESDLTLVAAQAINGNFPMPSSSGSGAHWPHFPPGVTVNAAASLSPDLKTQLTLKANWTTATDLTKANVVLQISGFPSSAAGAWVRAYPRQFQPNATLTRGDGQGGMVSNGAVTLELTDPLSLCSLLSSSGGIQQITDPANVQIPAANAATLMFDMAVVLPNGAARIYGGLTVGIGSAVAPPTPPAWQTAPNPCAFATWRGISNAGVLGLGKPLKLSPAPTTLAQFAALMENILGEGQPRDAPRLPTMARRELLAAGAGGDAGSPYLSRIWSGLIGGGRIAPETVCASSRTGAPGGLGGRETSVVAAYTHGGLLAYDIARHALRRSLEIAPRLVALASSGWNMPAEPAAVALGGKATIENGTMAGAVLQTIAPFCESPELYGLYASPAVGQWINNWIQNNNSGSQGDVFSQVNSALQNLLNNPPPPQPSPEAALTSGGTLNEVEEAAQRLAAELERELTSVQYGRRDAQWALQSAIQTARHLIYIETPGFCSTAVPVGSPHAALPAYAADLIALLREQMEKMPGLRVIVCVPKKPDFAPGYEPMASYEVQDRLSILQEMPWAEGSPSSSSQFTIFHPVGFPGRFARVETNVVVIDDIWAMIGGATFRRRGLTFDGSTDLVFTDTLLENGRSAAIRDFRRALLANRLGVPIDSTQPTYVALSESRTAFTAVQQALTAGGKIVSLWDGKTPGLVPTPPQTADESNPDGRELDFATAVALSLLGGPAGI